MTIVTSEVVDKPLLESNVIIRTHTEDGREEVRFQHGAISQILGRYACEQFPELQASGSVYIELTTDEYDHPMVVVTEASNG